MRSFLTKLKNYVLLRALLYLALGILLLINPTVVLRWMLFILAGYFACVGIINIIGCLRARREQSLFAFDFFSGILSVLLGILLVVFSRQISAILHIFMGILVLLSGLGYLSQSRNVRKTQPRAARGLMLYACVVLALGLLMVFNPFAVQIVLFTLFGATLTMLGISDIVCLLLYRKALK